MASSRVNPHQSGKSFAAENLAWPVAPDVYCVGPSGRTQTNVYFVRDAESWVLIDAGWASDGGRIERAGQSLFGSDQRPEAILLTHCHPDHSGAAMQLARHWGCPVYMHPRELPIASGDFMAMQACAGPLDRWLVLPVMRAIGRRRREALLVGGSLQGVARTLEPGAEIPGLTGWECIATPGHTPGHVAYFRPDDRVLISGDAVVTLALNSVSGLLLQRPGVSAPPRYTTWSRAAAVESIRALARLEPEILASGHGMPMAGGATAALKALADSL